MKLTQRLALCWRILRADTGNLFAHADAELPDPKGDETQELMNRQLREIVLVFSTHGHSGYSAAWARNAIDKLLAFKPLRPLTGEPDEWHEVGPGVFQNKRCSHVFKDAKVFGGQAYNLDGCVFREPDGTCFTSSYSRVPITFPYTPTTEYVDVPAPEA